MVTLEEVHQERLQTAIQTLHHVTQFVAMTGKAYHPHSNDDAHTTLLWEANSLAQVGLWIEGTNQWRLGLDIMSFALFIENTKGDRVDFPLHLEEKSNVISWLQMQFTDLGIDPLAWQWDLHYTIPDYPFDEGVPYRKPANNILRSYATQRTMTQEVLAPLQTESIRIWPHHFDTGALIQTDDLTIGLGWAIPDSLSEWPYWYATRYPAPQEWATIDAPGDWWTDTLQGRALPLDELWLLPDEKQQEALHNFFTATIAYYRS